MNTRGANRVVMVARLILPLLVSGCSGRHDGKLTVEDPDCGRGCPVVFERIARLGADDDTIWPTVLAHAVQGRNGRFYLGPTDHPGTLIVYSGKGRFIGTFGRTGQGPGEYSGLLAMVRGPGDTISVIDRAQLRRTLIDSAGNAIRTHRVPSDYYDFAAVGKRVFVNADVRTPRLTGYPVHELAPDGSIRRSFAHVVGYRHPEVDGLRWLSAAGDSGLWVAPKNRYEITFYDTAGNPGKSLRPDVDFFPPDRLTSEPAITDVWQDQGQVWVVIRVLDLKPRPDKRQLEAPLTYGHSVTHYDWLLEVLDIGTGQRLVTLRFDNPWFKGSGDGLLYGKTENDAGGTVIIAYRVHYRPGGAKAMPRGP